MDQRLRTEAICVFVALFTVLSASAATVDVKVYLDTDNNAATGCSVLAGGASFSGAEQILTTTYDPDAKQITSVTRQQCVAGSFGAAGNVDAGGWAVGSTGGVYLIESHLPWTLIGAVSPIRLGFFVSSGTLSDSFLQLPGGAPILYPQSLGSGRHHVVLPDGSRTIILDGNGSDWNGIAPISGAASASSDPSLRFLSVALTQSQNDLFFRFDIQSNAQAPTAVDDSYTSLRGATLTVGGPGVLGNDHDPNNKPLTAVLISGPQHGTLTLNADGSFTYVNDGSNPPIDSFRYKANNGSADSNTAIVTIDIISGAAPKITSPNSTIFSAGTAGTFQVTATGNPPPSLTMAGTLPSGVTFNPTTGVLGGTPAPGSGRQYLLTFKATNVVGTDTQTFTLTVNEAPKITSANNTTMLVGSPASFGVTASGFPLPTYTETGALPSGVTFNALTHSLTGTPAASGVFPITFTVSNVYGNDTQNFTLTVNQTPAITSANATTFTVGAAGSFNVTATGFPAPTLSESGTLPSGVTFNTTSGLLAGTPATGTGGTYAISFTATNLTGSVTQNFTLTVNEAPKITSANSTSMAAGTPANFTVTATGFPAPTITESGALPSGVTFNSGVFSGTPLQGSGGVYSITLTASNAAGSVNQTFTITVCNIISVTNPATNSGVANAPFSQNFTQTGGVGATTFALASGTLPAGLTLAANGTVSGTPTQTGTFPIIVTATDVNGCSGTSASYNLTITCQTIAVTNPAIATGVANTAFNQVFTASNTIGAVTFTTASTLPAGLTLANNGTLSGTPTQTGTFPIVVTATDANGCSGTSAPYNLIVSCQTITVNNPAIAAGVVNAGFSQNFTATNSIGTTTFTLASGVLPAGLTLASNGTLSGVPLQSGTFPITVKATDANGCSGTSATYNLTIGCQVIAVTNPANATGTVSSPFSEQFTASNTIGAVTFSTASTLPAGLTLAADGTLSGTPTQTGTFPIVVTATDANGCSGSGATYNLTINCQVITVTNPTDDTIPAGTPLPAANFTFTQSGAVGGATFTTASTLPIGVTLTTAGVLTGTPMQGGAFPITVTVTDGNGCTGASSGYTLTVTCPVITVTNPGVSTGTANTSFSQTFTQSGGIGTITWSETGALPAGITLDSATGILSGTPTEIGTFPITVTATDQNGCQGTGATYNLTITCQTITVTNPATTTGTANAPFSQTFTASNTIGTVTFTTASTLPAGLTLASNGTLSGTPTQTGSFPIVVTATDANGCQGTGATYTLTIGCQIITVTNPATTGGTVNAAFSQTFTASNTIGTTTFTTASTLPAGLTLATNGTLSGVPLQPGTFPIVVTATDANGCTGTGPTYNLVISCQAIPVTNPVNTSGTVNAPFSEIFTASNTIGTVTFTTASTLPTGLTLATDGTLSGTPTQSGTFPIVVTATDGNGCSGNGSTYTLVIACQTITVTDPATNSGTAGQPFTATFTQSGGIGTITWSTSSTLPVGITLNSSTGVLSGTPTETGAFPIVIVATDSNGCTGDDSATNYTLTIGCNTITVTNPATTSVPAGSPLSAQFTASGNVGTITWSETGALPTGITLNSSTGLLAGTTSQQGSFPITVTATDSDGCLGTSSYTLTVTCPTITVTRNGGGSFPAGTVGAAYSGQSFTASGGSGSYTFAVTSGTFPTNLSLSSAGVISGTPTATGTFTFTVTATDTASSCTGSQSFSIAINPAAGPDIYGNLVNNTQAVVTGGATTSPTTPFVGLTGTLISNDLPNGGVAVTPGTFATTQGGSVTIAADGTFIYTPPVSAIALASDTFTYTIMSDTGGTGTPTMATGSVTLNLSGRVWYVKDTGANGNGQSQSPFNSLGNFTNAARVSPDTSGDIIFVYNGTPYDATIKLLSNEQLIGQGVALVVNTITLVPAGTKPQITNASTLNGNIVTLNDGDTVKGLTLTGDPTHTRAGISGTTHTDFTADTLTVQNNPTYGIELSNMSGTITITNSVITNNGAATQGNLDINNGFAAISVDNTNSITANPGQRSVSIQSRGAAASAITIGATIVDTGTGILISNSSNAGGPISFTGSQTLSTTTNAAITLTAIGSATINFSGPLGITTTSGAGILASGANTQATVNFSGNLTINTGTGTAFDVDLGTAPDGTLTVNGTTANITTGAAANGVRIANAVIGGSGVTFTSVNTSGATNGISLVNDNGAVVVNGGTITNGTTGVSLQGASTGLTLDSVTITGPTTGITNTTNFGTLTINSNVSVSAATALNLTTGTVKGTFSSVSSTGGTNGVNLNAVTVDTGGFGTSGGSLTGASGATFNVNAGGGAAISWAGTVSQANAANVVTIAGGNSNSITISGNVSCTSNCTGLSIGGSSGSYSFSGGTNTFSGAGGITIGAGGESGSVGFSSGTTVTTTGSAFVVDGTTGNVTAAITYSGTMSKSSGGVLINVNKLINPGTLSMTHSPAASGNLTQNSTTASGITITNSTSTSITIANASVTFNNSAPGFTGSGNTGATINLGGLELTGNGNKAGMLISGSGTINVSDGAASSFINLSGGTARAIDGTTVSYTGTLNLTNATMTGNSGADAVTLTGGTLGGTGSTIASAATRALVLSSVALTNGAGMASVTSTGGVSGISLTNCTGGTYTVAGGALSGNAGSTFAVTNGSATFTYNGTMSQTGAARVVNITGITGGTITLGGSIAGSGSCTGITVSGTGGTFTSTGGITLDGTADTFSASGSGLTVNITGTNSVGGTTAVTSGVAVSISNATIGASNVTFQKISQNGGSTGIYLNNTGAIGTFTVTGNGSAGSGGTIQNTTGSDSATNIPASTDNAGSGVFLYNTKSVSLSWMQINDHQNYAIYGNNISTSFTLDHSTISGTNGNNAAVDEGSIAFDDLHGSATISNSNISGGWEDNLRLRNTTGSLNRLTVSSTTFGNNNASNGNAAMNMAVTSGAPTFNVTVTGCTFTGSRSHFVQYLLNGTGAASGDFQFTNNTITQAMTSISGAGGVYIDTATNATAGLTYNIQGNTIHSGTQTITGGDITVAHFGTGNFTGTIDTNMIGTTGVSNSGSAQGSGITVDHYGGGTDTVHITNNTVRRYNDNGIEIDVGDAEYGGQGTVNVTVTGNTVAEPETANALHGLYLDWGLESTPVEDAMSICATIGGAGSLKNTLTGSGVAANGGLDLYSHERFHVTVRYPGYGGANNDNTAVGTFLNGQNTMSANYAVSNNVSAGGGGYVGGAACP